MDSGKQGGRWIQANKVEDGFGQTKWKIDSGKQGGSWIQANAAKIAADVHTRLTQQLIITGISGFEKNGFVDLW